MNDWCKSWWLSSHFCAIIYILRLFPRSLQHNSFVQKKTAGIWCKLITWHSCSAVFVNKAVWVIICANDIIHTIKSTVRSIFIFAYLYGCFWRSLKVKVGMTISIWHLYHHAMSYSAFSGMFVDVMPLFNHDSYILIKFLRLVGENVVIMDKMSFFHLNIEFCTNFLRDEAYTLYST